MAIPSSSPSAWIAEYARALHEPESEVDRLRRAAELAVELLTACDHAGVTLMTPDYVETAAATDSVVRRGDAWQHELSEGPCLDAARQQRTVLSSDLLADAYWPTWGPRVVHELGVRAMLSLPLSFRQRRTGALNLYADRIRSWDTDQLDRARTMSVLVGLAAADAREIEHRTRAMISRTTIGQAQGIVMARFDLDADAAFDVLRGVSQHEHRRLAAVAAEIVSTRQLPDGAAGPTTRHDAAARVSRSPNG